jgi:hypothetical protein
LPARGASIDRPVLIGVDGTRGSDEEHLEMPTLGGPFAAALTYGCLAKCAPGYVEVFDLRTRRRVSSIGADPLKLLLGAGGGVAIVKRDAGRRWIQVWDARGMTVVTGARERDLPLRSAWMQGDLLRWTQAGVPHSFLLRGRSRQDSTYARYAAS